MHIASIIRTIDDLISIPMCVFIDVIYNTSCYDNLDIPY